MSDKIRVTNEKRNMKVSGLFCFVFIMIISVIWANPVKAAKIKTPVISLQTRSHFDKHNNIISRNYIIRTDKNGKEIYKGKTNYQLWYRVKGKKWKIVEKKSGVISRKISLREGSKNMEYKIRLFKVEDGNKVYGKFSNILKVPAGPKAKVLTQSDGIHIVIDNLNMKKKYHTYVPELTKQQKLNEWKIFFSGENGTFASISSSINNDPGSKFSGKDASFEDFLVSCSSSKSTSSYELAGSSRMLSKTSIEYIVPLNSTIANAVMECRKSGNVNLSVMVNMKNILTDNPVYVVWE